MESVQRAASAVFADCFGLCSELLIIVPRQDFSIPYGPGAFFCSPRDRDVCMDERAFWESDRSVFGARRHPNAQPVWLRHIAVTDVPLATMWFLTTYSFWKGLSSWKWSLVLGIVWGLALSTKFPAVLILIPLVVWAHLFQRDKYVNNFFAMLFLGPVVMVATQPYLWHQTGLRVLQNGTKESAADTGPKPTLRFFFPTNFFFQSAPLVLLVLSSRRNDAGANRYSSSAGNGVSSMD